ARAQALELGLVGHARNMDDGRVEVVAQGRGEAIDVLVGLIDEDPSRTGRPGTVTGVVTQWSVARAGVAAFVEK
ncbi:MAG: acylphosphatase, partial [Lapillicoccus sp.]